MKSYRDLEIYQSDNQTVISMHKMNLTLSEHEMHGQGRNIRRSGKDIKDNKYERKQYLKEFFYVPVMKPLAIQKQQVNGIFSDNP